MKHLTKLLAAALLALGLNQAVWADDASDFRETLQLAEQGDAKAQNNLGAMYANGQGVRQDYAEAFRWFSQAAEQGYAKAQFNLGVMYYNGYGVRRNFHLSKEWFGKACDSGWQKGCDQYRYLNQAGY